MKNISRLIVTTSITCWSLFLLLLLSPNFAGGDGLLLSLLSLVLMIAILTTIPASYFLFKGFAGRNTKNEKFVNGRLSKSISVLILGLLSIGAYSIIKSLWMPLPMSSGEQNKFFYENLGVGLSFIAIVLTLILSSLQKDIYWFSRNKKLKLDERQLQERRAVFETSYKITTGLVIAVAWAFGAYNESIVAISKLTTFSPLGHIVWLGINFVTLVVAVPMIVAAWQKKQRA